MTDPDQSTFDNRPTRLNEMAAPEPVDERGARNVLVSSSSSRTNAHRQDPYKAGTPLCGQELSADHTEWIQKPKGAMKRSKVNLCPDCYPGGSDE